MSEVSRYICTCWRLWFSLKIHAWQMNNHFPQNLVTIFIIVV